MQIIADTHCHTLASTHAYSTLTEVVRAAADKGLLCVGITDHGRAMPGAPREWYFDNLDVVPDVLFGVRVLRGIEANIIDFEGKLDERTRILGQLDWVIASMHEPTMKSGSADDYTRAWLCAAENPLVHVIGHSGSPAFPFDYERVIPVFGQKGKLVEINQNTFFARRDSLENCRMIARLCKEHGVRVVVNSDSHFHTGVGEVGEALELLASVDFPEELVVNSSRERFDAYLRAHTRAHL